MYADVDVLMKLLEVKWWLAQERPGASGTHLILEGHEAIFSDGMPKTCSLPTTVGML
jgi:hypothetical protein